MKPAPPPETRFRRPDFRGGLPVRLADGQEWACAGPREIAAGGPSLRTDVVPLLNEIAEADDAADRLRGELALAIALLSLNYDLSPADYARLLGGASVGLGLDPRQADFHVLANRHAEAFLPRAETSPVDHGRRFRFPAFLPHRRAPQTGGRDRKKAC